MGVLMQAFYWNCPDIEKRDFHWWEYVESQVALLSQVGFSALWLPPASKGGQDGGKTMGYDGYDYYDLGDIDQKGTTPTWFGTKATLLSLITTAHEYKMQVYADLVLNQNSGGDAPQVNPIDHKTRWTSFQPLSNRFRRDWECFQPSYYEAFSGVAFGDMPLLCHRNPDVFTEIISYARWLLDIDDNQAGIGFDGFRYDCAKGYGAWMTRAIQELRGLRDDVEFNPFGVGEVWDTDRSIENWLTEVNTWSDNPVSAFDFSLRDKLKNLCDTYGYSLKDLNSGETLLSDDPPVLATWVIYSQKWALENNPSSRYKRTNYYGLQKYTWFREQLYLARNTRSSIQEAVLGTTYIYMNLMYSSVTYARFGNDFIFRLQLL